MYRGSKRNNWVALVGAVAGLWAAVPNASAYIADPLIEGAKLCTTYLPRYEREYGIPTHLLSAIASTESGRYHEMLGMKIPWPWTINVEGKGHYFATKAEAIAAVRKYQAYGIKSIDVGCMQVNLYHHPQAFASLDSAFEPRSNIAYAASFLRNLYQSSGSWKRAAAEYHSKTPVVGTKYAGHVYDSWYQILDKLREAKMQVNVTVPDDTPAPYVRRMDSLVQASQKHTVKPLPEQVGKKLPQYKSPHMNVVELSNKDTSKENGIIVVRPDSKTAKAKLAAPAKTEVTAAQAPVAETPAPTVVTKVAQVKPAAEIISVPEVTAAQYFIDRTVSVGGSGSRKSGPTFIFND